MNEHVGRLIIDLPPQYRGQQQGINKSGRITIKVTVTKRRQSLFPSQEHAAGLEFIDQFKSVKEIFKSDVRRPCP